MSKQENYSKDKMIYRFFGCFSESDGSLLGFPLSEKFLRRLQRLLVVARRAGGLLPARLQHQEVVDVKGRRPGGVWGTGSVHEMEGNRLLTNLITFPHYKKFHQSIKS